MAKTAVNKTEALATFTTWTKDIVAKANAHIKRLNVTGYFSHGDYVSCVNKEGKVVMYLTTAQIQWRKEEFAPEGAERNSTLFFEKTGAERPTKAKAEKPAGKTTVTKPAGKAAGKTTVTKPAGKAAASKPTADDVDAALADA